MNPRWLLLACVEGALGLQQAPNTAAVAKPAAPAAVVQPAQPVSMQAPGVALAAGAPAAAGAPSVVVPTQTVAAVTSSAQNDVQTLWYGVDMPDKRAALSVPQKLIQGPATRNLHVFALQNSGADLLNTMLYKNFGNKLNYFSGLPEDAETNHRHGFWMHSDIKEKWRLERDTFRAFEKEDLYTIVIIRNPMSWLQAMRTHPFELAQCVTGEEWLTKPCVHTMPGGTSSSVPATTYPSLEGVWNHWNIAFHNSGEFGFKRRLIVPYENLVRNPEGTMDHIAKFLELEKPEQGWAILAGSAGSQGSQARDDAFKYMYTKGYLKEFKDSEKSEACVRLDKELQAMFGYDDCKKPEFSSQRFGR